MKLSFPAPANPFKRRHQPIRVILTAKIGPTAHTGAQLRRCQRIRPVIRVETGDPAILNMGDKQAASATIVSRAANAD